MGWRINVAMPINVEKLMPIKVEKVIIILIVRFWGFVYLII